MSTQGTEISTDFLGGFKEDAATAVIKVGCDPESKKIRQDLDSPWSTTTVAGKPSEKT